MRLHCGREMELIRARERAWRLASEPLGQAVGFALGLWVWFQWWIVPGGGVVDGIGDGSGRSQWNRLDDMKCACLCVFRVCA